MNWLLRDEQMEVFDALLACVAALLFLGLSALVLWPVGNDGVELRELLGQGLVDGVVLMEVQLDDPRVDVLRETGTPFALIGRTTELEGLSHVDIDFDTTVQDAIGHLYDLGHRELMLVSGDLADPDRKSTRLNSSHYGLSRMPSSA